MRLNSRSFRSSTRGLAIVTAPSGTLIAYATAPGSVASDGDSRNGLYTQEILKNMQTMGLTVEDVFKRVRIAIRDKTNGKQVPWETSSLLGDVYFNPRPPKHIGEWEGVDDTGEKASFIFDNKGHAMVVMHNQVASEVNGEFIIRYEIDYDKEPISLDIIVYDAKGVERRRMAAIIRFLMDDKMQFRTFFNDTRPDHFIMEDKESTIVLTRVIRK